MSLILAPPTVSPGKLAITYHAGIATHQASVNYIQGVDISNLAAIQTDADQLSDRMALVTPPTVGFDGWKLLSPDGQTLASGVLTAPGPGSHGTDPGMRAYQSPTIKILGTGIPASVLTGNGRTSLLLFVMNAYALNPLMKRLSPIDTPLTTLVDFLNASTRFWADFYGQKAAYTGRVHVQFNAHEQKRTGS
jgi:hypothetical protein